MDSDQQVDKLAVCVQDMKNQFVNFFNVNGVDIKYSINQDASPIYNMGNFQPIAWTPGNVTLTMSITLFQNSATIMFQRPLLNETIWDSAQHGLISKWLDHCGVATEVSNIVDKAVSGILITLNISVQDIDMFMHNVSKVGWEAFDKEFTGQLEGELSKAQHEN